LHIGLTALLTSGGWHLQRGNLWTLSLSKSEYTWSFGRWNERSTRRRKKFPTKLGAKYNWLVLWLLCISSPYWSWADQWIERTHGTYPSLSYAVWNDKVLKFIVEKSASLYHIFHFFSKMSYFLQYGLPQNLCYIMVVLLSLFDYDSVYLLFRVFNFK